MIALFVFPERVNSVPPNNDNNINYNFTFILPIYTRESQYVAIIIICDNLFGTF